MKELKISAHSGIRIKNLIILAGMLMIKFVYAHFILINTLQQIYTESSSIYDSKDSVLSVMLSNLIFEFSKIKLAEV